MRYLYADSTPFPLPQNFLATICAGTDACVAILKAEELLDECNRMVREAEVKSTREVAQLQALAHQLELALGPGAVPPALPPAGPLPVAADGSEPSNRAPSIGESTLAKIRDLARTTLEQSRLDSVKTRDGRIALAAQAAPRTHVMPALSAFLSGYELPDTAWGIRWTAGLGGAATRAELQARTPFGLEATFDVAIPAAHVWARSPRASMLGFDASISMIKKPLVGKARPVLLGLGELAVTHVVLTPDRALLRLSRSATKPSDGIEFVFSADPSGDVTATRVDKAGYPLQEGERLSLADANAVQKLWSRVTTLLGGLVAFRTRASAIKLGGVSVAEVARPLVVAQAVIRALAPYIREIAARTSVPRELALKRELGDGCREELFIHYETVVERIKVLSPASQAQFDVFGLREERVSNYPPAQLERISSFPAPAQLERISSFPPPQLQAANTPSSVPPPSAAAVYKLPPVRPPTVRAAN